MKIKKDDVVRVRPVGRKNIRLVRVVDSDYVPRRGLWSGWLCNDRGGWVLFRARDVIEKVPDPYAEVDTTTEGE